MVAPEIAHQIGMDGQLPQLTPAQIRTFGRGAVTAAATIGALAHPVRYGVLAAQLSQVGAT